VKEDIMKRICRSLISLTLAITLALLPIGIMVARTDRAKADDEVGTVDSATMNVARLNKAMLDKINGLRAQQGVGGLEIDDTLNSYAATRSVEAATKWSHTRPNGAQGCDMIPANKWRGENLSYVTYPDFGYSEAEQDEAAEVMFNNLVASPTHYDNMVFGSFTKIGIRTSVLDTGGGTRLTTAYMFSS
jgi:uncharacterized protein YkwD